MMQSERGRGGGVRINYQTQVSQIENMASCAEHYKLETLQLTFHLLSCVIPVFAVLLPSFLSSSLLSCRPPLSFPNQDTAKKKNFARSVC